MKGNVMTRLLFCVTVLLGLGGSVWGQDASLKIKASKEAKTLFVEEKLTLSAEKTGLEANETITWSYPERRRKQGSCYRSSYWGGDHTCKSSSKGRETWCANRRV